MKKPEVQWVITSKTGIQYLTNSRTKEEAIRHYVGWMSTSTEWYRCRKSGLRAIRVKLVPCG